MVYIVSKKRFSRRGGGVVVLEGTTTTPERVRLRKSVNQTQVQERGRIRLEDDDL